MSRKDNHKFKKGDIAHWCPTGKMDQWWHVEILGVAAEEPVRYKVMVVGASLELWRAVWVGRETNVFEKDLSEVNPLYGLAGAAV